VIDTFETDADGLRKLLAIARGDAPADLLLTNCQLVDVFGGEVYPAEVALCGDRIAGVSATPGAYMGRHVLDLHGQFLAPGFIDAHVHIESSLLTPAEFATAVVPCGTTAVVCDPHEIANVYGLEGIRYMLEASAGLALRVYVMLSPCVPATDMETSGATLTAADLAPLLDQPRVLGIAEMMNYPGVVAGSSDMLTKLRLGHAAHLRVDGHAPLLGGRPLQAYAATGISSDHESVSAAEALEKLRAGMQIFIREGSTAKNLDALLPIVNMRTARFCSFATDDKQPDDLQREGHLDHVIRRAISAGLDPILAIQMATINTARHYGLHDMGAVAPGYRADLVAFPSLEEPRITHTICSGAVVAAQGHMLVPQISSAAPPQRPLQVAELSPQSFVLPAKSSHIRAIEIIPEQIVTREQVVEIVAYDGRVEADPAHDLLKIAVVERHRGTGNVGVGLLRGFGLNSGALASSIAHDSHNIVVIGATDPDMLLAARTVLELEGGLCAVRDGHILATLPLPIAGLMSDQPLEVVRAEMAQLLEAAHALGCPLVNPYMAMAFLALPVIPELKITDKGLVDVRAFALCSPYAQVPSH
jgi:adenine deaminase